MMEINEKRGSRRRDASDDPSINVGDRKSGCHPDDAWQFEKRFVTIWSCCVTRIKSKTRERKLLDRAIHLPPTPGFAPRRLEEGEFSPDFS